MEPMIVPRAISDDRWPECDPEYIEALGRAVYNFAVLEISVVWIMEHFKQGYLGEYGSQEKQLVPWHGSSQNLRS
jgi:hypothetical protein